MRTQGDGATSPSPEPSAARGSAERVGAPTLVRLVGPLPRVGEGDDVVLTATVRTSGGAVPSGGSVRFRAGDREVGSAPLVRGEAVLVGVRLPAGVHEVTAAYGGDEQHAAGTSQPVPQTVTAPALAVMLLVAPPRRSEEGLVLEAELVERATGRLAGAATGALVFTIGSDEVAVAPLEEGHARVTVPDLPPGPLRAAYEGDPEHAAAVGSTSAAP